MESYCEAWPQYYEIQPAAIVNESSQPRWFRFDITYQFFQVPSDSSTDEDELLLSNEDNLNFRVYEHTVQVPYEHMIDNNDSFTVVYNILHNLHVVPVDRFIVERILYLARSMARDDPYFTNHRILPMTVYIEMLVNELSDFEASVEDSADDINPLSVIEKYLTNIKVVGSTPCVICLEDILEGSEASCLSCSHRFHKSCILKWLEMPNRMVCPLCRLDLASS